MSTPNSAPITGAPTNARSAMDADTATSATDLFAYAAPGHAASHSAASHSAAPNNHRKTGADTPASPRPRTAAHAPTARTTTSVPSPAAFTPQSFDEATDISDHVALRKRLRRNLLVMRAVAMLLLVAAVVVAAIPVALQLQSSYQLAQTASTTARDVAGWPYPQAEDAFKAARAYNDRLAQSGQPVLGEAVDPFTAAQGGSQASGDEDSAAAKDKEYQSLLDAGNGIMGTIKVPKQSISLPIYHGTSAEALNSGAGHLYGTSLPVGGASSHSVITGHRGLVSALMFTRLDEMRKGDFFYAEVMGETIAYEVDRISVILPDDTSQLRIVPGEDRMTLMTCTPYGVNTHRLLVSGHRVAIPLPAPEPGDLHDGRNLAIMVGVGTLAVGWFGIWLAGRRQFVMIMRHAAWWPDERRRRHAGAAGAAGTGAAGAADTNAYGADTGGSGHAGAGAGIYGVAAGSGTMGGEASASASGASTRHMRHRHR